MLLYRDFAKRREEKRARQLIIASVLIPVLFNAVYLTGVFPFRFDITPLGFGVSVILILTATMRYQFMDVNVTAFDLILSGLPDGVGVFDRVGKCTYANQAFLSLLEMAEEDSGCKMEQIYFRLREFAPAEEAQKSEEGGEADAFLCKNHRGDFLQIRLYQPEEREAEASGGDIFFTEVSLQSHRQKCATVLLVQDRSWYYTMLQQERELAVTSEKLALERERNRIAQQVHDTAGHTLTMLQSYMKLAMVANRNGEQRQAEEYLTQARSLSSEGLKELRLSINQMRREENCELVTQGIVQLADQVKEIPVELTVQGEDSEHYSHLSGILYSCAREAVTNALKYAEASKIEIVLRFHPQEVELVIGDDGKGCGQIRENNGIRGIRERIEQAGGTVRFVTAEGEGFLMRLLLPCRA